MSQLRITSVAFKRYKAFSSFQLSLHPFNVLVGPNNSGKSTIISAFRILAEGMRKARARVPDPIHLEGRTVWGYRLSIADLPIAAENIFNEYDDSSPAEIRFRLSNGNHLKLLFPEQGACYLIPETDGSPPRTTTQFKLRFDVEIGFVPILGPVDQREPLFRKEAARLALLTSGASRNFRNIWYHFPEHFEEFKDLICRTWPGMDIDPPSADVDGSGARLTMFCPEERFPREICWAGYGFQVWCQMLTFIVKARDASILVIDEPDIYLHSDLQRQLVALLRDLGPDILIATHSTEIISESEPSDLLTVSKRKATASRVRDPAQLKRVFSVLGSNLNPTLTQLAKSRRALFVEGLDFQVLAAFARTLGFANLANRSDFAVIASEGFNPAKTNDLSRGVELTIGSRILRGVILDRDYRPDDEVREVELELRRSAALVRIHGCKEIENYLLSIPALDRAIGIRLRDRAKRTGKTSAAAPDVASLLEEICQSMKHGVLAQFLARQGEYFRRKDPRLDQATINERVLPEFERRWNDAGLRLRLVPGKDVLARLNAALQQRCEISLTDLQIAQQLREDEMPTDLVGLIREIEQFRHMRPED